MVSWPMDMFVDIITSNMGLEVLIFSVFEWFQDKPARRVYAENMKEILAGIDDVHDRGRLISRIPPHFFVWSNDLGNGVGLSCGFFHKDPFRPCPYGIDWNPSIYPFDDLIEECPDFSLNPPGIEGAELSRRDLRRQQTRARYTRWNARAEELARENPDKSKSWIANRISREAIAEGCDAETIRKNMGI